MGVKTRIYQLENDLAINIPTQVLPPGKMQLVEERVETPGYDARTTTEYYVLVRPYSDRTAILLTPNIGINPAEAMSNLGLNPDQPIFIRLVGTREWIRAHRYHGYYGRVWIPRHIARETDLRKQAVYPVFIQGITFPHVEIRTVRREVKDVTVMHMGKIYHTENYDVNKWRWRIPKNIESYPVLSKALTMNIYPEAECHPFNETVLVDFVFTKASARVVSKAMGYAFRNMAVRNYTATVEVDYPFLCEIRATYLSCTPKEFYQPDEKNIIELKKALEITVYNILQHFFNPAKEGYKYSAMSYAEFKGKIDYTKSKIDLRRTYPSIPNVPLLDIFGEATDEPSAAIEYPFYQCIKYVRVITESAYKTEEYGKYVYDDDDINATIIRKNENLEMQGLEPRAGLDINGFIWE